MSDSKHSDSQRDFDLILFGATGFTGQLVAEYLANRRKSLVFRFAIAGRDLPKLEQIKAHVVSINPELKDLECIKADSFDVKALNKLARRTRVVISTVGPFSEYGTPLVKACLDQQTCYADITGETTWVRSLIDKYHNDAQSHQVLLVPMCGFDSIPADLGALFLAQSTRDKYGCGVGHVQAYVDSNGGPSGGTIATMMNRLSESKDAQKKAMDPFLLNPARPERPELPVEKQQMLPKYDKTISAWTTPWVMAGVNTRVVRRSQALAQAQNPKDAAPYGPDFTYNETMKTKGFFQAVITLLGLAVLLLSSVISCLRPLLRAVLPKPGQGPSAEKRASSYFRYQFIGHPTEQPHHTVEVTVSGGDPGYSETAKMLSESGLLMALEREHLPAKGGVLTPATALGARLIQRLNEQGIKFEVNRL